MGVILRVDVFARRLENYLESPREGGEVGVGCDALADELIQAEPSIALVHVDVEAVARGSVGLSQPPRSSAFELRRRGGASRSPRAIRRF